MTNDRDPRSERTELLLLCRGQGLDVVDVAIARRGWRAQVTAIDRLVWVEDQEDIDWLLIDLRTAPIQDGYSRAAQAA